MRDEGETVGEGARAPSGALAPFGFISRRRLLQLGLGAGGVMLAGGAGLWALQGAAPEVAGLKVLSARRFRTLAALAEVHLPPGGDIPYSAGDLDLPRAFDAFLADEPEANVRDLGMALTLVELGPLLFERRFTTFTRLTPAARLAHWQGWMTSSSLTRRQAATAFRKFFSLVYYDTPEVWPHLGYPGPEAV